MVLTELPYIAVVRIMSYVSMRDIISLSQTSMELRALAESDAVWKRACRRLRVPLTDDLNLKQAYVAMFEQHRPLLAQISSNQVSG